MRIALLCLALTLALLSAGGCGRTHPKPPAPPHGYLGDGKVKLEAESRAWVRVEAAPAAPPTARRTLFARVAFDERRVTAVGSPVSGRVIDVRAVTGEKVERNAPLVVIHSADIAAARADLLKARQARMLAAQTAARNELLFRQGAGSEADAKAAETALTQSMLDERRATEALGAIGAKPTEIDFVLRAPRGGIVIERSVSVGNTVAAASGAPLVTIADLGKVWVLVDVYEHDLDHVQPGDAAHVYVSALREKGGDAEGVGLEGAPGRRYDGKIAHVGTVVDAATRVARARIELDNADGALRPGMFARVDVESIESAKALIPTSAVLARRDRTFVFVEVGEGLYEQRPVRLGLTRGETVGVIDGVKPGDRVVTRGAILLDAEANTAF